MNFHTLSALQDEFEKISQGALEQTRRRASVAGEFATPVVQAALLGAAVRGLGVKDPKKILAAAALGAGHGILRKTRQYAG